MAGNVCSLCRHGPAHSREADRDDRTGSLPHDDRDESSSGSSRTLLGLRVAVTGHLGYCGRLARLARTRASRGGMSIFQSSSIQNEEIQMRFSQAVIVVATVCGSLLCFAQTPPSFDLVIAKGHIIDGTGSPWYSGDLGVRDGKIAAIGNLSQAARKRTIDAKGMVVAP